MCVLCLIGASGVYEFCLFAATSWSAPYACSSVGGPLGKFAEDFQHRRVDWFAKKKNLNKTATSQKRAKTKGPTAWSEQDRKPVRFCNVGHGEQRNQRGREPGSICEGKDQ